MLAHAESGPVKFCMPTNPDTTVRDVLIEASIDMHGALSRTLPGLAHLIRMEGCNPLFRCRARMPGYCYVPVDSGTSLAWLRSQNMAFLVFDLAEEELGSESSIGSRTDDDDAAATAMDWKPASPVSTMTREFDRLRLY